MKVFRSIAIVLVIVIFAAFMCIMFLPVDTFIAERKAAANGYDVPDTYEDIEYRYYYNNLNKTEQLAYRIVDAAFFANPDEGFPKEIVVPDLTNEELNEVFTALSYDNPEYYFLGNKCNMNSIGSINYFVPQYLMSMEEYNASWEVVKAKIDAFLASIPSDSTDYNKELLIHDFIIESCDYAESGTSMIYTMHGVFADGSANCEGYARTAQYLLRECGIYNYLAIGEAEGTKGVTSGHMWNIVKINDEFYNLDVTWDDYSATLNTDTKDGSPSYVYFNISTKDLKKTHSVDDEDIWSSCKADSFMYFINNNTYIYTYDQAAKNNISSALARNLSKGYSSIEVVCADEDTFEKMKSSLIDNSELYSVIVYANRMTTGQKLDIYSSNVSYQYTADEDKYVLRFFFNK